MKTFNFIKKATKAVASVAFAAGIFFSAGTVYAIPYNGDKTVASPTPAFNVFTGVDQGVGNESDFLRARAVATETDATTQYSDPLSTTCDEGQLIQLRVYVHNGASAAQNDNGTGPSIAHGTKVKIALQDGERSTFNESATISSTNAGTITDNAVIDCNGKLVTLNFKSASAFSAGTGVVNLTDDLVKDGVLISSHGVAGDVWGCWDDRVYVVLNLTVKEVKKPVVPVYTCDLLTVTKLSDNKFRFAVNYTVKNGATFNNVTYSVSDGTSFEGSDTTDRTFAAFNGSKNVTATVNFTVDGKPQTSTNENCVKTISAKTTPKPPTSLPNTGAGSTIGMFLGATIVGAFIYRMRALREM